MHGKRFARHLRRNMTDAECLLWRYLRAHRLDGGKFRRQQPIGPYVVDFVQLGAKLIVECDGGQHNDSAPDARRDFWLKQQGFRILRFWNHDILNQTDAVLDRIHDALSHPSPLAGEGPGERGQGTTE